MRLLFTFLKVICWWYYCVSHWGWMAGRIAVLSVVWCKITHRKMSWPLLTAVQVERTRPRCCHAQFHHSSMLLCSLRSSLHPEGSHSRVQRADPINKHERTGLDRLLIKSNMWGGKLSSWDIRESVWYLLEGGTASLVLLKWLDESIEGWHSGVFENRSDLDYFQAACGRSVCGFTRCCVAGEHSPLYSELTGVTLCKRSGVWKELERLLISFYQT